MNEQCNLCIRRPGWSGYARMTTDGLEMVPCRCVTEQHDKTLYGHRRNRLAMLRELAKLNGQTTPMSFADGMLVPRHRNARATLAKPPGVTGPLGGPI